MRPDGSGGERKQQDDEDGSVGDKMAANAKTIGNKARNKGDYNGERLCRTCCYLSIVMDEGKKTHRDKRKRVTVSRPPIPKLTRQVYIHAVEGAKGNEKLRGRKRLHDLM